jgi:hypothetical protein
MTQHTVQAHFFSAFQQFWRTDPGLHLLATLCRSACQDCAAVKGWTKGGCLVAARGIEYYIADSLEAAADLCISLVAIATDETEAAHVLVALWKDGEERFLDAQGVWTRKELLRRLALEYQYDAWALVPWKQVVRDRVRIPFDKQVAQAVAATLIQTLGPFPPERLFTVPEILAV